MNGASVLVTRTLAGSCTIPVAVAVLFVVLYSVLVEVTLAILLKVVPTEAFCFIEMRKSTFLISPGFRLPNPVQTNAGSQ